MAQVSEQMRVAETTSSFAETAMLPVAERMKKKGVPAVTQLVENLEQYLTKNGLSVKEALRRSEENQKKYKLIEYSFLEHRAKLKASIDDYKKSLAVLAALEEQQQLGKSEAEVTFKLDENLYSRATVDQFDKVCIYLGASVMVEYELREGTEMLEDKLKTIRSSLAILDEELDFIRDQITTSEVNSAQLHNHRVQLNQRRTGEKK